MDTFSRIMYQNATAILTALPRTAAIDVIRNSNYSTQRGQPKNLLLVRRPPRSHRLLDIYDKGEREDLTPAEKKVLKKLAEEFKAEAIRAMARKGRSKGNE
jgi:hypothetical protein